MKKQGGLSWKDAWKASPGPRSTADAMLVALKGACMGAADTIPGVSGGTIALVTGIYEQLLAAVKSVDAAALKALLQLDFKGFVSRVHLRFLLPLLSGIGIAILSLARLMTYLLLHHPVFTWSLFFGLVAASVWVVGRKVESWNALSMGGFAGGAIFGFWLVGLVPAQTPETPVFVFFSGMLAICAMILPGISGAFILLILGKYAFILSAVKNPFIPENAAILLLFLAGCAVGLAGFSRVLKFLLDRYHAVTMALLAGLMVGSMRKLWPWKVPVETSMIGHKMVVLKERCILPDFGPDLYIAAACMAAGIVLVMALDRLGQKGGASA